MSTCDVSSCSVFDEDCICLKGFNISFSWDHPDNWCLKDVQENVFHILDANDKSKPDNETLINVVQSSGTGVVLTQPNPERDVIPCELNMKAHPDSIQFCITKILVISEARHIELYINDMYDKTSKGSVLSMRKGKKAAIYESQLDLSAHVQGTQKVTLKFLSLADKESLRLQAIVLTIIECANTTLPKKTPSSTDVNSVREMIKSMNLQVSDDAEKLMKDIENQQKQNQMVFQNLLQSRNSNPQQMYQLPQNMLTSQAGSYQNILAQQVGNNQNILPAQLEALQSGVPTLNNIAAMSQVTMPTLPLVSQQTQSNCCLHSMPTTLQQQSLSFSSHSNVYDKIFSKSCPGSRTRSPTQACIHSQNYCQVHSPVGHVINRNSCVSSSNGFEENGCSHVHPPSGHVMNRNSCVSPNSSLDGSCLGPPNPPNESVLANAILNERPSKEVSRNRISLIEQENHQEAQVRLHNMYNQSETSLVSHASVKLRHADNVSRKCLADRKRRAKSLCSMPTDSEMDFSKLLTEIIKDETQKDEKNKSVDLIEEDNVDSKMSNRWESYLRSRVRVNRRSSDTNDNTETHNGHHSNHGNIRTSVTLVDELASRDTTKCKECGCSGVHTTLEEITKSLTSMELKLTTRLDSKVEELRNHIDKRLDTILEIINVQPFDYDETLCSNTEV